MQLEARSKLTVLLDSTIDLRELDLLAVHFSTLIVDSILGAEDSSNQI